MLTKDFDYSFLESHVAAQPVSPRSSSRMMVIDRNKKNFTDNQVFQLPQFLNENDLVVMNTSYVRPARFKASKATGGGVEGLFLEVLDEGRVRSWLQGKVKIGERIRLEASELEVAVAERDEREVVLNVNAMGFLNYLDAQAFMALPPYIRARRQRMGMSAELESDRSNYQSIVAEGLGGNSSFSIAAPTASLHFDHELLTALAERDIRIAKIKLHVGLGTFAPIEVERIEQHPIHSEEVGISQEFWREFDLTKKRGGRVLAVGTTVCRALEAGVRRRQAGLSTDAFCTALYIYGDFKFEAVDILMTNFHQPRSSLLVLVESFLWGSSGAGDSNSCNHWRKYYQAALASGYRFFSFGDAMLIL